MRLTTREDVIKAGYKAINTRGEKEYYDKFKNRVEEYGKQQKNFDNVERWWRNLDENFSTLTIEKFNESLSDLPLPRR